MGIKDQLKELDSELWGIVSVYNPEKSRKVLFHERHQYRILREIQDSLYLAQQLTDNEDLLMRLKIIERSVLSLAKAVDALKAKLAVQQIDMESTAAFFSDSSKVSILSDSYVDEMETHMEKIRFISGIIDKNIDEYLRLELAELIKR